jgi:signal transduction histidine kinase
MDAAEDSTDVVEGARLRQRAAELLREAARARARLHAQLMQAPVAVSVVTGPDYVFELANSRYLELTGRTSDVVGKPLRVAFAELPEDAPIFEIADRVYRTGVPYFAAEKCIPLVRNGRFEEVYFHFDVQPVFDEAGAVVDMVTVAIDVTAQVEERLRREGLMKELQLADQRKDEFLAMLAHELRNPMAAISTALSLLELTEEASPTARRYRETAQRQMTHLVRLVDDLLDVARITRGKVELRKTEADLAEIVREALAATRSVIEARGHELTTIVAPGAFRLEADATRLEQVVVNLLTNAAKYTDPGGRITVRLGRELSIDGEQAVLSVRDNGRGIPREMIDRVFDLFTQVSPTIDRRTGGLGLGLTLVKRLVELHGGSVAAASEGPGRGSELTIRLPIEPPRSPAAHPAAPAPAPAVHRRRVVVVEDSPDVRELLQDLLAVAGHEVIVASDGIEGVSRVLDAMPDVALIDVGLPYVDGYEVARRIRAAPGGDRVYLVAITGYGGPEVAARATAAGFDLQLTKPVESAVLVAVIERAAR